MSVSPRSRGGREARVVAIGLFCLIALSTTGPSFGQPFPATIERAAIDGELGFVAAGDLGGESGASVSLAGDVNGDGFDDLLIGAPTLSHPGRPGAGAVFVLFGGAGFPASVDLSSVNGVNGFVLRGAASFDRAGDSVAAADFNGDGFDDIIVGAPEADPLGRESAGEAYLVLGRPAFPVDIDLGTLEAEGHGFSFSGVGFADKFGTRVASAGDFNGDGFDDLLVGAPGLGFPSFENNGGAFVLFGRSAGFSEAGGAAGVVVFGRQLGDGAGESVVGAGDLNGDGIDDILVGAPSARASAGEAYVVYGSPNPPLFVDLAKLAADQGVILSETEASARTGRDVAAARDLTGDGRVDLVVGRPGAANGELFVVFGTEALPEEIVLPDLDGRGGFIIDDGDIGRDLFFAGDVNGDAIDDLVVGAGSDDEGSKDGYVLFGSTEPFPATLHLDLLDGTDGFAYNDESVILEQAVGAGDINDDGLHDVVFASSRSTESVVIYGSSVLVLETSGRCGDEFTARVSGSAPSAEVSFYWSPNRGTTPIETPLCPTFPIDLDAALLLTTVEADGQGDAVFRGTPPPASCGARIQAFDTTACRKSALGRGPER